MIELLVLFFCIPLIIAGVYIAAHVVGFCAMAVGVLLTRRWFWIGSVLALVFFDALRP